MQEIEDLQRTNLGFDQCRRFNGNIQRGIFDSRSSDLLQPGAQHSLAQRFHGEHIGEQNAQLLKLAVDLDAYRVCFVGHGRDVAGLLGIMSAHVFNAIDDIDDEIRQYRQRFWIEEKVQFVHLHVDVQTAFVGLLTGR